MDTITRRDGRGAFEIETRAPLGFDRRELRLTTGTRFRGGLSSVAHVVIDDNIVLTFGTAGTVIADRRARRTHRNTHAMHVAALTRIDDLTAHAIAHYRP